MTDLEQARAALSEALLKSRPGPSLAEFEELLAGVSAAPRADDPMRWSELLGDEPDEALIAATGRMLDAMAAEAGEHGIVSPAPRARLDGLRAALTELGVDGFIVPRADAHQSEYIPASAHRLAWLTGFTGSAGLAVVLVGRAAVFTDGRYTLQIRDQVDGDTFEIRHVTEEPASDFIADALPEGGTLAYDPWLHTEGDVARWRSMAEARGGSLKPLEHNPIDALWADRPADPISPIVPHADAYTGESSADKRKRIGDAIEGAGADAAILSAPESIAWLFNVRGGDVPNTPLPLSFAVLDKDGTASLFADTRKIVSRTRVHLGNAVEVRSLAELDAGLAALGAGRKKVLVDPATSPARLADSLRAAGATVVRESDPVLLPKARKNSVELAGTREAHIRDGAAFVRFLHWLDGAVAANETLDEIGVAARLRDFRAEDALFRDVSFETISGSGPNGAIVHYRVLPETNRTFGQDELYLVDSGAQYLDGTTDITRTVAIGSPGETERDRFTRVLKGHIAIATLVFPKGTSGSQIDALARAPLWSAGLDFDHGTGHGVGTYLGVHEGPQRISKGPNTVGLEPGMMLSNEPGYYAAGAFGIRIENLIVVEERAIDGGDRPMLGFETITLAPIDRRLIEPSLLSAEETAWLDGYHRWVRETLSPRLDRADDAPVRAWLDAATAPIGA